MAISKSALYRLLTLFILVVIVITGISRPVFAIDQASLNSLRNNTPFYDPNSQACSATAVAPTTAPTGGNLYIIGDSYSLGLKANGLVTSLTTLGYSVTLDGSTGRSINGPGQDYNKLSGNAALVADKAAISAAATILIILGTNGQTSAETRAFMSTMNSENSTAKKYWLNVGNLYTTDAAQKNVNDALAGNAASSGYTVIDWNTLFKQDPTKYFLPKGPGQQGLHPEVAGWVAMRNLILSALSGAATGGTATAPTTGTTAYGTASLTASKPTSIDAITKTSSKDTNATTTNAQITYQYFVGKGLTPYQAVGILGNLAGESHFRADNASEYGYNGWPAGGYGISQWTGYQPPSVSAPVHRRYYLVQSMITAGIGSWYRQDWDAGKTGLTPPDKAGTLLGFELDYMWWELNGGYKGMLADMKKAPTYQEATRIFYNVYESPASTDTSLPGRTAAAQHWLQKFSGLSGLTGVASGACSTSGTGTPAQTTGQFIYYNQNDPKWASDAFNGSTIKISGCGATSYAMAVANLNNTPAVTPATIAAWSQSFSLGYVGVSLAQQGVTKYGIQQKELGTSMSAIVAALQAGHWVIISGSAGHAPYYGGTGHIVLAHGITGDGKLIIADPERGATDQYTTDVVQSGMKYAVEVWK